MIRKHIKPYNEASSTSKKKKDAITKEEFTEMFREVFDLGLGKVSTSVSLTMQYRYELNITKLEYDTFSLEAFSELITTIINCSKRMPDDYKLCFDPCFDEEENTISVFFVRETL